MPKDKRLWMKFPNDFWQHPKIAPLSDAAFRAFVELNGYSRMQDLDGRIAAAVVARMWPNDAIEELQKNHPERPSLSIDGSEYVIWNYDEHQETKAERAARQETNTANGKRGGRPRKTDSVTEQKPTGFSPANPGETNPPGESEPNENQSQSQSQSQSQRTDTTYLSETSHLGNRARESDEEREFLRGEAGHLGIDDVDGLVSTLTGVLGEIPTGMAIDVARVILSRASTMPRKPLAYVTAACREPENVRAIHTELQRSVGEAA